MEVCGTYGIVFFVDPQGEGLLWAAGTLSESPEGADGGFAASTNAGEIQDRRQRNAPCTVIHQALP